MYVVAVAPAPSRTSPAWTPATSATARRPSSTAASAARARGRSARPAAVGSTPRRSRCRSRAPKCSSRRRTAAESAGCDRCAGRAAAVKERCSTMRSRQRSSSNIHRCYRKHQKDSFDKRSLRPQGRPMFVALVVLLGIAAGFLTTVAGMGGGLLLVTALAVVWGPHVALPVTSLALLVGNLHRLALYRRHLRM